METVKQEPGWWKVVDRKGVTGFYEFRADGRARGLRVRFWDWCKIQGDWTWMDDAQWLEWANLDSKPEAVWGEPDFLEKARNDPSRHQEV